MSNDILQTSFGTLLRRDHMTDRRRIIVVNNKPIHFVCKVEMAVLEILPNGSARVGCLQCGRPATLKKSWLRDYGLRVSGGTLQNRR